MKQNLRIPGPTPLPEQVQQAMARDMIDHRGPEFAELLNRCTELLKKFYRTESDLLIFPGAGTGGLEAAVVNSFSPGDAVLAVTIGVFGDKFAKIAEQFGLDVRRLTLPRGRAVEPETLLQALEENSDVTGVLITHNETSTGVTNPIDKLAPLVKERGLLLLVDAVSSMGAIPVHTDRLGLDVVVSGSQKAWMIPPGLVMVSVSKRAWEAADRSRLPRYYWDFKTARSFSQKGQTPITPAVSLFYALDTALQMMEDEGLQQIWERHHRLGEYTRREVKRLGLELFSEEKYASDTVTAIRVPDGMDGQALRARLREEYGVVVGGGQAEMTGRILRVGHMGHVTQAGLEGAIEALGAAVRDERSVAV